MAVKVIDVGLKFNGTLSKRTKTDYIILHHSASSNTSKVKKEGENSEN